MIGGGDEALGAVRGVIDALRPVRTVLKERLDFAERGDRFRRAETRAVFVKAVENSI